MKNYLLSMLILFSPLSVFASGLTENDLVGDYTLIGNGGFLAYDLALNMDGTAILLQKTIDGSEIRCLGRYNLDAGKQDLVSVYNCEGGNILSQKMSLMGTTRDLLALEVTIVVRIKSNSGTDASVTMVLKKQ